MATVTSLGSFGNSGASTTVALTAGANIVAGDLVVVIVSIYGAGRTVSSITDGTNTYTKATGSNISNFDVEIWYKENATAVTSPTITATLSSSSSFRAIGACRVTGAKVASSLDIAGTPAGGTSTSASFATGTLSQAAEIIFGAIGVDAAASYTGASGFTNLFAQSGSGEWTMLDYQIVASTTTVTFAPAWGGSHQYTGMVASFKLVQQLSLTASPGAYVMSGIDASLGLFFQLIATVGSYTLAGVPVTFNRGIVIAATAGAYVLTGISAAIFSTRTMIAASGAYVLTGIAVVTFRALKIIAAVGSYTIAGPDLIVARFVAPASKFLIRQARYVLQRLRGNPPTLGQ